MSLTFAVRRFGPERAPEERGNGWHSTGFLKEQPLRRDGAPQAPSSTFANFGQRFFGFGSPKAIAGYASSARLHLNEREAPGRASPEPGFLR